MADIIAQAKINFEIILQRISAYIIGGDIYPPKPEMTLLFDDYNKYLEALKGTGSEIFGDLRNVAYPTIKSVPTAMPYGSRTTDYVTYEKTNLRLLKFELEKALKYIGIYISSTSTDEIEVNPFTGINLICARFHAVARQIRKRYGSRATIDITDEYDVQDLIHSLLRIFYKDIRPEEYSSSYAGGNSRIDFILKDEQVAIEIKKSRKSLRAKEIGEELIIDTERYKMYPGITHLYCFVYDPEGWIENPNGLENDLTGNKGELNVVVIIEPKE
jgi:hypothetical protein